MALLTKSHDPLCMCIGRSSRQLPLVEDAGKPNNPKPLNRNQNSCPTLNPKPFPRSTKPLGQISILVGTYSSLL